MNFSWELWARKLIKTSELLTSADISHEHSRNEYEGRVFGEGARKFADAFATTAVNAGSTESRSNGWRRNNRTQDSRFALIAVSLPVLLKIFVDLRSPHSKPLRLARNAVLEQKKAYELTSAVARIHFGENFNSLEFWGC